MRLPVREASAGASVALLVVLPATAVGDALPSDADTPTDAPSAWNGFLPWLLIGVGGFALLLTLALGIGWASGRSRAATDAPAGAQEPPEQPEPPPYHASTREIAVLTFGGIERAERAYARVIGRARVPPWQRDVAFVERHRHGRLVVRGTFAGRYVDVDGPPGSVDRIDDPHGALLSEIRGDVPEGSSALVIFGPSDEVGAMADAFRDSGGRLTRYQLSDHAAASFSARSPR